MTDASARRIPVSVFDGEQPVDAQVTLEGNGDQSPWAVVLESRSGSRKYGRARNPDYVTALELILARLCGLSATLEDVSVVSAHALRLDAEERRLPFRFPMQLRSADDFVALRKNMTEAQRSTARTARARDAAGGNNNKRLRLQFTLPFALPPTELAERLARPRGESA